MLESIPGLAFKRFPDVVRELAHGRNGVYALYSGDRLYYVGLARDLRSRLKSHLKDRHAEEWDRFSLYLTEGDEHLKELESLVLRIADPKGNRVKGKLSGTEDLRPRLMRRIREMQRAELDVFGPRTVRPARTRKEKPERRVPLDERKFDTIVCPAHEDGFKEVFLGENMWRAIRISDKVIPRLKYIAIYVSDDVKAITHYGRVKSIQPWKRTGKYAVLLKGKAIPIGPIPWGNWVAIQGPRLTAFRKLRKASTLAGAF